MTVPKDMEGRPIRSARKWVKFLMIMIILVAGLAFGLWFFFISDSNSADKNNGVLLPANCYSVNGKQTCPLPIP